MKHFLIIGHKAVTSGDYSLNDMPGSAGRMDILCRCVSSAFFLSHDLRRDVQIHLLLLGEPHPGRYVRFEGEHVRYLSPDERSAGALIKKALQKDVSSFESRSTPGVNTRTATLKELLDEFLEKGCELVYLREDGDDLRSTADFAEDTVFILGDHVGVTEEEEKLILDAGARLLSIGPLSLHANHCITIIHNELDRRGGEKQ
ncbi:tRNA (pseudouridine54-N1)-methyltransferase [Methanohalophilus levihalophilus]|uniref:tRNA (pseudouridine(54)-N(1))-methyltransferase TrmY n=1 Tax=Methanohalophilus levihalophilus TaxID=1431282 RepID=UPI001AE7E3FD|nr:tRNA (pseudouridine(54)-N(1))-methyltransferase TrmY [Methanohalophilus levihalophilus]MBP2029538.1 tRNA (pseudouridine54-N1)-methyltransferase [Methanohalophilus levihalophilus]